MFRLLFLGFLLVAQPVIICSTASALDMDEANQALDDLNDLACRQLSALAKVIMTKRQQEEPISEMLKKVNAASPVIKNDMRLIVVESYSKPVGENDRAKEKIANEFKNEIELRCYKGEFR